MMNAEMARRAVAYAHDTALAQALDNIDSEINKNVRLGNMSMTYYPTAIERHLEVDNSVIRYMKSLGYDCKRRDTGIITISWKK